MPEVELVVRWADGTRQAGCAPSRAIQRFVVGGGVYPRAELERRLADGLAASAERVRERHGFACTGAAELAGELAAGARAHGGTPDAPARMERVAVRHGRPPAAAAARPLPQATEVVVIGAGQAGLSLSRHLQEGGIEHVVLERDRMGGAWTRGRWDSFCLVTPNWQCRLPGHPYTGPDPDGFMVREQIVEYLEAFARSVDPPVWEGVAVTRVQTDGDGFVVDSQAGRIRAAQVALCVSGYHRPRISPLAKALGEEMTQLHSSDYRNPGSLPDGAVLVVGTGQSGAQIAEDLHLAGRRVHLAVGSAPRCARRYRGRDCITWLSDTGHYDMGIEDHPKGVAARHEPNHYMTGRDGGHDLDLRALARDGMALHGRLTGVRDGMLQFAGDLREHLDGADAAAERIKDTIDAHIARHGIDAPPQARYTPVWEPSGDGSQALAAADCATVIWATGFDADWSWVAVPGFLDAAGEPAHRRGVCAAGGLSVLGLPWLWSWGSGRFAGIDRDAAHVAAAISARARTPSPR